MLVCSYEGHRFDPTADLSWALPPEGTSSRPARPAKAVDISWLTAPPKTARAFDLHAGRPHLLAPDGRFRIPGPWASELARGMPLQYHRVVYPGTLSLFERAYTPRLKCQKALRQLGESKSLQEAIRRDEQERQAAQTQRAVAEAAATAKQALVKAEEGARRRDEIVERLAKEIHELKEKLETVASVSPSQAGASAAPTPSSFPVLPASEGFPAFSAWQAADTAPAWPSQSPALVPRQRTRSLSTETPLPASVPQRQRTRSFSNEPPEKPPTAAPRRHRTRSSSKETGQRPPRMQAPRQRTRSFSNDAPPEMPPAPAQRQRTRSLSSEKPQTSAMLRQRSASIEATLRPSEPMPRQRTLSSSSGGFREQHQDWHIDEERMERYKTVFVRADLDGDGFVEMAQARQALQKASLSEDDMGKILTLADVDKDGRFTRGEFVCALHLAYLRSKQAPILPGPFTNPPVPRPWAREGQLMASKGLLACNPFREVCCSNNAAEHSDVYDGAQGQNVVYNEEDVAPVPQIADIQGKAKAQASELVQKPEVEVEGGARYKGQWKGNMRHGHGVLTRADGHRYEGAWFENRAHGHGTFTEASGTSYEGQWHQDQKHGYGKYVHIDGTTYEGEWHADEKSGRGIETWSDGARYEGEFLHGSKHGVGIYKSGTGVQYEGQFHNDQMDGEGCYRFANGRVYVGQWSMGHMSGIGKMEMPDGSRYEGGYERDMKHGEGTFTWADGRVYQGQWRTGKQDGNGVLIDTNGRQTKGFWRMGERLRAPDS
eukprot:s205_g13.t2